MLKLCLKKTDFTRTLGKHFVDTELFLEGNTDKYKVHIDVYVTDDTSPKMISELKKDLRKNIKHLGFIRVFFSDKKG